MKSGRAFLGLASIGVLSAMMAGCSQNDEPKYENQYIPCKSIELNENDKVASEAMFKFGFEYVSEMVSDAATKHPGENVVASPLSASVALAMLGNTVGSEVPVAVCDLLGISDISMLNDYNKKLLNYLPANNDTLKLALVNNMWVADNLPGLSSKYLSLMADVFQAQPQYVDFTVQDKTKKIINDWADYNTCGMIPKIVEMIDSRTMMMFANAMYFRSEWEKKFDKANTSKEIFHGVNGDAETDMMHAKGIKCLYRKYNGVEVLGYSFKNNRATMYFVLPPEGENAGAYFSKFTADDFNAIIANGKEGFHEYHVDITLPRYKIDSGFDLNDYLGMQGINLSGLDLSAAGIVDKVNMGMNQFASVEVNEDGAEASAVTVVDIYGSTATVPATFTANRPFGFYLIEEKTNSILAAGVVNDPNK